MSGRGGYRGMLAAGAVAVSLVFGGAGPVQACAFDMIKPTRTAIDWIVESKQLVLARPDAQAGFSYAVVDILAGAPFLPPIKQLVDSSTRRRLLANPEDTVLFAREPDGSWRRVVYVNAAFRPVLVTARARKLAWATGFPQSRVDLIESLQTSRDIVIKSLVIAELDKVPYAQLRQFDLQIDAQDLLRDLWSPKENNYQAIRALLLGLSGTPEARAEITRFVARAADRDWFDNLGAFAAAYIELEGGAGVEALDQSILRDAGQPLDKVEQVVMALSVHHALSPPEVQGQIDQALTDLVALRPDAAVIVARQFTLRANWTQAGLLEPFVQRKEFKSLSDMVAVSVYVASAKQAEALAKGSN